MSAPGIRAAEAGDLPAVLDLWAEARAVPGHTDNVGSLAQLIDHDPGALLVAEKDGRIVGTVIAAWDGWRGSIYRLTVAPASRREGLGTRLVDEAEGRLGRMGATRMQATVEGADERALGFWRAGAWQLQDGQLRFTSG